RGPRRCRESSQFVAERLKPASGRSALQSADHRSTPTRVAYHPSCHLQRGLRITREPRDLIASVRGAEAVRVDEQDECCGFGGLFSIKNAEISASMMDRKLAAIAASGADRLVSCDLGCLRHPH